MVWNRKVRMMTTTRRRIRKMTTFSLENFASGERQEERKKEAEESKIEAGSNYSHCLQGKANTLRVSEND